MSDGTTQLLSPWSLHLSLLRLCILLVGSLIRLCNMAQFGQVPYRQQQHLNKKDSFPTLTTTAYDMKSSVSSYASVRNSVPTLSIEDRHHTTPATSDDEMRVGPSRAHFRLKYHEIAPLAVGANGETFYTISKKAASSLRRKIGSFASEEDFFNALRAEIVVAKFPKGGRGGEDELTNEIAFLTSILPLKYDDSARIPLNGLLDHHSKGNYQWHTTALAKGGDIYHFIKNNTRELTLGLRWHLSLKIAEAMAYLQYGETGLLSSTDGSGRYWPRTVHGDLHSGNILLTSSSEGSFRGYPDLRLADFGRSYIYVAPEGSWFASTTPSPAMRSEKPAKFQQCQIVDFRSAGTIILGMALAYHHGKVCSKSWHCRSGCGKCCRADCDECIVIGKRSGKFEGLGVDEKLYIDYAQDFLNFQGPATENPREEGLRFLRAFAKVAAEQREKHYVPLSHEAMEGLDKVSVSDSQIDQALGLGLFEKE